MTIMEDFEEYFVAQGINPGVRVCKDSFVPEVREATCIYEYVGEQGPPQITGVVRNFQFVARSPSSKRARDMAIAMWKALQMPDGILHINDERWMTIQTRQTPFKFKTDENNLVYYAFNVGTITYLE